MYDTINMILSQEDFPDVNFITDIPALLDSVTVEGESRDSYFINGYIGTFRVNINQQRIKLQGSSLGRYINGDNQTGMSLQLTRKAVEQLSDQLSIDVGLAKVTQIDIGRNLTMKYKPETYLPYLIESSGYKRHEVGSGLYFKNSLRELVFYDKIREQKEKRIPIQPIFQNQNLLRYELRLKNHLEKELSYQKVVAKLLYDEGFYIKLGNLWKNQYLRISKQSNRSFEISPTSSARELIQNLAALAITDVGIDAVMHKVTEWQQKGILTKKQAADQRKAIRDSVKKTMKFQGNEFIEELDKKIKLSTRYFI